MKSIKLKLALLTVCGLFIMPTVSAAYEVTATNAQKITDDTVMFSITYKFGFLNRDMRMPIVATTDDTTAPNKTSFVVRSGVEALDDVSVNAMVLSSDEDLTIEGGQYYLPRGRNAEFTLLAFVTLGPDTPKNALQLAITNLPYTMIDGDSEGVGAVLDAELPAYRTPFLTLAENVTITAEPVITTSWK